MTLCLAVCIYCVVSINSTSEEVRSRSQKRAHLGRRVQFPLIQLPRKSEVYLLVFIVFSCYLVSINSTSEEVRSNALSSHPADFPGFPLIQLPRKSEDLYGGNFLFYYYAFPLIQLPRKSEVDTLLPQVQKLAKAEEVSINSTSEEVRSGLVFSRSQTRGAGFH